MIDNIIYSLNAVLPLIIMLAAGFLLKKSSSFSLEFWNGADKLVFNFALPVLLFNEVANARIAAVFDVKLIVFAVCGIVSVFLILALIVPLFIKSKPVRGSFIQGIYRANFAILGVPLAANLAGNDGAASVAFIIPFTIPLFNILAVIILSVNSQTDKKSDFKKIFAGIVKNPLIIAIFAAIPFMFVDIIPLFAQKTLSSIANLSTPLALLSLGAGINFSGIKSRLRFAIPAAIIRLILIPAIYTPVAILIGLNGPALAAIFILFSAPTAVSSYIMAKNMGCDFELSADIIALTTIICPFTVFVGSFILKQSGFL